MATNTTNDARQDSGKTNPTGGPFALVICGHCDWRFSLQGHIGEGRATLPRCPHCFHPELSPLAEEDARANLPDPELILPFTVNEGKLHEQLQAFARGIPFFPSDLSAPNLIARLERVYLPMWLVDTDIQASWNAEMGYDYDVVSHQEHYGDGRGWDTREVTETRIRWEPRLGRLQRSYQNLSAPALEEHDRLQAALGAFHLDPALPFGLEALADSATRLPDREPEDAWPDAVLGLQAAAAEECRQAAAADHVRGFRWSPTYSHENWTHLLQPLFTTYYLDDEHTPQPILIHGQTGHLKGPRRASMARARRTAGILLAIGVAILLLGLAAGGFSVLLPALLLPAGIGVLGGLLFSLGAGIPILVVWQFNRSHPRKGYP